MPPLLFIVGGATTLNNVERPVTVRRRGCGGVVWVRPLPLVAVDRVLRFDLNCRFTLLHVDQSTEHRLL